MITPFQKRKEEQLFVAKIAALNLKEIKKNYMLFEESWAYLENCLHCSWKRTFWLQWFPLLSYLSSLNLQIWKLTSSTSVKPYDLISVLSHIAQLLHIWVSNFNHARSGVYILCKYAHHNHLCFIYGSFIT